MVQKGLYKYLKIENKKEKKKDLSNDNFEIYSFF